MHTLRFFINVILLFFVVNLSAQKHISLEKTNQPKDSISYKTAYGLRLGIDISKPILSLVNEDYKGLEFVSDYRIAKKWYVATEFGYEQKNINEEVINASSSGKYIRLGVNYNTYNNWLDMNNEIYFGARYGFAKFNQTLNSFLPKTSDYFPIKTINNPIKMNGLNIQWVEFQLGLKVETFKNLFLGFHGSYKIATSIKQPDNFKALYSAGFNRIYESKTGFGFNYTISYLIPFTKK